MKNYMVFFLTVMSVLLLVSTVSAAIATPANVAVKVDGTYTDYSTAIAVEAGEVISVSVYFDATNNDTDVRVEAEIEGEKVDTSSMTKSFDVEDGVSYKKSFTIEVPYELKDEVSDVLSLEIELDGKDDKTTLISIPLNVQRPTYNIDVKSISASNTVEAGETFPVEIVMKNVGYNDLDDLYVTAGIAALGMEKTAYFGDLVSDEWNYKSKDDETDTVSGILYLKVPYSAEAGIYGIDVEVTNDDMTVKAVEQIAVNNDFSNGNVIANGNELIIVNPTDSLKVYNVVPVASDDLSISVSKSVVVIPAGSSETVTVSATGSVEGTYEYTVNVMSGNSIVSTATLSETVDGNSVTNPITILTIILVIVFVVLLIVLIVLLGKKPEKTEEFGESYY